MPPYFSHTLTRSEAYDWLNPNKTFKTSDGARSLMTKDTSCGQIKQVTFVWMLESDSNRRDYASQHKHAEPPRVSMYHVNHRSRLCVSACCMTSRLTPHFKATSTVLPFLRCCYSQLHHSLENWHSTDCFSVAARNGGKLGLLMI